MSTALRRAIYGKLAGDTTLTSMLGTAPTGYSQNIYYTIAPEFAPYPMVVFNKQSGMPMESFGRPAIYDIDTWTVKAVVHDSSADTAEAISDRFVTLLNDAVLSISGRTLLKLRRETDIQYPEVVDGEVYRHIGVLFRVLTASTT
jgi:hypothetical protein